MIMRKIPISNKWLCLLSIDGLIWAWAGRRSNGPKNKWGQSKLILV